MHYTKPLQLNGLGAFNYVFNYTDHLEGGALKKCPVDIFSERARWREERVSFAKDPQQNNVLKILEENHYYPFGMKHQNYNVDHLDFNHYPGTGVALVPLPAVANVSYNYKYNGKELQDELGLNLYDYGARNYDPTLGRWMNIDPLAEKYYSKNPYMYCNNNPLLYIDPNGMYFTPASKKYIDGYVYDLNKERDDNNSEIAELQNKIAKGGSERQLENWANKINNYKNKNDKVDEILGEINTLDSSNQVYHIQEGTIEHGVTGFHESGAVIIVIPERGYKASLLAHELKHAYQFEIGEISFTQIKGQNMSFLYDKTDELEAYKRGNDSYGIHNLPEIYKDLPTGPLNIHNNQDIIKALSNPDEDKQKEALQNIATKENAAFRVNGQTYRKY